MTESKSKAGTSGPALSPSEEATLKVRGHQLLRKLGEGSYAQVRNTNATDR